MRLLIPSSVSELLRSELRLAGSREIGGVLLGEHLGGSDFRIADVSVQRDGGTRSHFVRDAEEHRRQLEIFFEKTGREYARFNYLGEWHSHPSFEVVPSGDDIASMQRIVTDPDVGATFAMLMIVRLGSGKRLVMSATTFLPNGEYLPVEVLLEDAGRRHHDSILTKIRRWLSTETLGRGGS